MKMTFIWLFLGDIIMESLKNRMAELIVPNFGRVYPGIPPPKSAWSTHPAAFPSYVSQPRESPDSCQQALHVNMFLHHFLLRAATINHQQNIAAATNAHRQHQLVSETFFT